MWIFFLNFHSISTWVELWEEGQMRETMCLALFFNKYTVWRAGDSLTSSRGI